MSSLDRHKVKPNPEIMVLSRLLTAHFALFEAAKAMVPDTEEHCEMRLAIDGWHREVGEMLRRLSESLGLPPGYGAIPGVPTVAAWQSLFRTFREGGES